MRRSLIVLIVTFVLTGSAFAWGTEGHQVIVQIGLHCMKRAQREAAYRLLGSRDWKMIGHWADSIRPHRRETEKWHYVDIPKDSLTYDSARDCADDCILAELTRVQATLHDTNADSLTRREALLFWFHLIGDLYQPFHCYNNNDHGANKLYVMYDGHKRSLHGLWDDAIIKENNPSARSLAAQLYRKYSRGGRRPRRPISFVEAANQSHVRAVEAVNELPTAVEGLPRITANYRHRAWATIQRCLWEAGEAVGEMED